MKKIFVPFIFFLALPVHLHAAEQSLLPPKAIGFVESLTGKATAQTRSEAARILELRSPLFARDLVTTEMGTRLQLRLKDKTVFVMSQAAEIRLDKFVYDPQTGAGLINVYLRGVFRFVTGKIVKQNPDNMRVEMPVGTIGIRGTRVAGRADDDKSLVMLESPGEGEEAGYSVTVSNEVNGAVVETEITAAGYGTEITVNQIPEAPKPVDEEVLEVLVEDLGGMDESLNANPNAEDPFTEDAIVADDSSETAAPGQSAEGEAGTAESETSQPANEEPIAAEPEPGQPAQAEEIVPEPETTAPVIEEPAPVEPEPSQPAPAEASAPEPEAEQPASGS